MGVPQKYSPEICAPGVHTERHNITMVVAAGLGSLKRIALLYVFNVTSHIYLRCLLLYI